MSSNEKQARRVISASDVTSPATHRFDRTRNLVHYPKSIWMKHSWFVRSKDWVSIVSRLGDSPGFRYGTVSIAKTANPRV